MSIQMNDIQGMSETQGFVSVGTLRTPRSITSRTITQEPGIRHFCYYPREPSATPPPSCSLPPLRVSLSCMPTSEQASSRCLLIPRPGPSRHSPCATYRYVKPNVQRDLPTLLSNQVSTDVLARKIPDGTHVVNDVLPRKATDIGDDYDNRECDNASATNAELLIAALQRACDGSHRMCASLATVSFILVNDLVSHSRVERLAGTESKAAGQAVLERLFFNSMPADLVEVVNLHKINQTHGIGDFLNFLANKGSSLNIDIMFGANNGEEHQETPFAGIAHRIASKIADDQKAFQMRIAIVAMDANSNEKQVLNVRLVSYRLTDIGENMSDCDREDRFNCALATAMHNKQLLSTV